MRTQELAPVSVSIEEAAELLGVCSRTLWAYIRSGDIPAARLGRRVLIRYSDLQQLIDDRTDRSGACVDPGLSARRKATKGGRQ